MRQGERFGGVVSDGDIVVCFWETSVTFGRVDFVKGILVRGTWVGVTAAERVSLFQLCNDDLGGCDILGLGRARLLYRRYEWGDLERDCDELDGVERDRVEMVEWDSVKKDSVDLFESVGDE